jgi:quercetin dioxygenase-like cupin family protein
MALKHAHPGEVIDLRPLGSALSGQVTHSLLKTREMQLMRLVLPAGQSVPSHQVAGEITIHCLEGEVEVHCPSSRPRLRAGELLMLPGGEAHALTALSDASLLVTVLLTH